MDEQAILLRVPKRLSEKIKKVLDSTSTNASDEFSLANSRSAIPKYGMLRLFHSKVLAGVWPYAPPRQAGFETELDEEREIETFLLDHDPDSIHHVTEAPSSIPQAPKREEKYELKLDYRCVRAPNEYVFVCGEEEYHATLADLPLVAEVHQHSDFVDLLHMGVAKQMLLVHDMLASDPRPSLPSYLLSNGRWEHGVTAAMCDALTTRVMSTTPETRRVQMGVAKSEVAIADAKLAEFKNLIALRATASLASSSAARNTRTSQFYVREELVDEPAWMEFAEGDVMTLVPVPEEETMFATSLCQHMQKARARKQARDEKQRMLQEAIAKSKEAYAQKPLQQFYPPPQNKRW